MKNMSSCNSIYWKTLFSIQFFHTSDLLDKGTSAMPGNFLPLDSCLSLFHDMKSHVINHDNSPEKWRPLRFEYTWLPKWLCILWVFSILNLNLQYYYAIINYRKNYIPQARYFDLYIVHLSWPWSWAQDSSIVKKESLSLACTVFDLCLHFLFSLACLPGEFLSMKLWPYLLSWLPNSTLSQWLLNYTGDKTTKMIWKDLE